MGVLSQLSHDIKNKCVYEKSGGYCYVIYVDASGLTSSFDILREEEVKKFVGVLLFDSDIVLIHNCVIDVSI